MKKALQGYRHLNQKYRILGMSWQMIMSLSLVVTAFVLALVFPQRPWRWWCLLAMGLSFLGDILLTPGSILVRNYHGDPLPLGGTAFALAHVAYILCFWVKTEQCGGFSPAAIAFGGLLYVLAAIALVFHLQANEKSKRNYLLLIGMLAYAAVICLNCTFIFASALAVRTIFGWLTVAGAVSFYISDAILLCGAIGPYKIEYYDEWIWVFYPLGQFLLVAFA